MRILLLICFNLLAPTGIKAQSYHLDISNGEFYLGMVSHFTILCGPKSDLGLENITVLQHSNESLLNELWQFTDGAKYNDSIKPVSLPLVEEYGQFRFRMRDDLLGVIEIVINDGEIIDTLRHEAVPLPAVIKVGGRRERDDTIKQRVLKAQQGLYAEVENLDINARCPIISYEVTVAQEDGRKSATNSVGNFSEASRELIGTVEPGDLVLFRHIRYRCPGADSTGQRAPDMIFTVE
jgi:hypothetical protein